MSLTVSIEVLHHFRCGACEKWWSIGDFTQIAGAAIVCPHCAARHTLPEKALTGKDFKS